jgi:hypothetical protein
MRPVLLLIFHVVPGAQLWRLERVLIIASNGLLVHSLRGRGLAREDLAKKRVPANLNLARHPLLFNNTLLAFACSTTNCPFSSALVSATVAFSGTFFVCFAFARSSSNSKEKLTFGTGHRVPSFLSFQRGFSQV